MEKGHLSFAKFIPLVLVMILLIISTPGAHSMRCNRAQVFDTCAPCVQFGSVKNSPDASCCKAVKLLSLDCLCSMLVATKGKNANRVIKAYSNKEFVALKFWAV
ncbi:hypothetical protein SELMODRAFT_413644 [Selaginella moellendorffii]|uniref:Bifunctional inhibitor/plant lipid transfer protein/seed storage helical domain-containing protein n=1 Tax=Selaginella moellendorffii TaxID=88036 RepID=D8RPR7_SELML|nr:hypothetical protein SELMODRAFT_413644 [Selaginella moellendorffii]